MCFNVSYLKKAISTTSPGSLPISSLPVNTNEHMETNSLYHYCKLSTAIEYILADKRLLLNPVGKTNDPRENKSFVFAGQNIDSSKYVNLSDFNEEITKAIRDDCKMTCFSKDESPYFGYELSRMWALYGDNHKGVCLKIDKEIFAKENSDKISFDLFKRVNYFHLNVDKPIIHRTIDHSRISKIGSRRYVREEFRPTNLDYLFFTKNREWESEQEFRLLYFSDRKENEYCNIKNSLKAVYLGVDFNDQYLPSLVKSCNEVNFYKLEFREVRLVAIEKGINHH